MLKLANHITEIVLVVYSIYKVTPKSPNFLIV